MVDQRWRQPLDEAWAVLNREVAGAAWSGSLEVTGDDGRLRSRLPVEEVAGRGDLRLP